MEFDNVTRLAIGDILIEAIESDLQFCNAVDQTLNLLTVSPVAWWCLYKNKTFKAKLKMF